jgi:hypothetical protein
MTVILVFAALVIIGDTIAIGIATLVEHQFSQFASLIAFLAMYMAVFCGAWLLAVRITERYLVRIN